MEANLTQEQADVFVILENMRMKVLVTRCVLVAFFVILVFLFLLFTVIKSTWQEKAILGVIEAILGGTMYPLVNHYLPSLANSKAAAVRTRKTTAVK